ncbi:N-acetylglucosamine-6-phosphate deacetylase [Cryptosporangium aurantiacum]|uniref:N-acetylglucosamine 6-phosphate deacetylase n=1 Tax=Cryptosporangium aurantiacum TaxID=134849 RepID=A0A1M7JH69_9ACTN|nr:N-acetylglucosamine-6-phosphate deacetylase [Cryptosporangium aurantiacum]SHM52315.1 N-acetylglucosamine 6-phosphate deacetylase [Cryptosporangium aurantiacum]
MTLLIGARVVTPSGVLDSGWVSVEGSTITDLGTGPAPGGAGPVVDLGGGWLLPGFVDLHVHGGGGHDFTTSADDLAAGVAFHASRGTTRTLISLVTAPVDALAEQLRWVADAVAAGSTVVGAHLEGPFLASARCGAQNPAHLIDPDAGALRKLLDAGRGTVRVVTVAPERPGGLELIDQLVAAGVVAAVGHTDADYATTLAAFERGASMVTHAFNGMRGVHHREPGPVPAALDAGVACELINDGVHVHPAAARLLLRRADRLVLVTDAIDATGVGDGTYVLGGQDVVVSDGQARLASNGSLAGSTLTMDAALRRAVTEVGMDIVDASAAASGTPARLIGLADRCGAIAPGLDADLVLLDDDLELARVLRQGAWLS